VEKNMIPVNRPKTPKKSLQYTKKCLKSGWLSSLGSYVTEFEQSFAKYIGVKYAVSVNSGTTALHTALLGLGIGSGDEVILPASTIGSCYFAIWYVGAKAVAVDVDPRSYNIDPNLIEAKITNKTKAIMVVHLYGQPAEMNAIMKIAKKHKLMVIEDAAEAHGAEYYGKKVGSIGDVACFSFYANKIVTSGKGGMVITNNKKLADKCRKLRNYNFSPKKRFIHDGIGYNYVMSNLQAAIGLASLEEISSSLAYKQKLASFYTKSLKDINGLQLPIEIPNCKNAHWMYVVLVDKKKFGLSRDQLSEKLMSEYGIQTRDFFYPPELAFPFCNDFKNKENPIAAKIARDGLYLPSGIGNTMSEFRLTVKAIKSLYSGNQ